jgi:hypothetical protein
MPVRLLAIAACVLSLGTAQADDGDRFLIDFELWLYGETQGEPRMIVVAGQPASMEVGGAAHHWRIEVEVERPAAHEYAPGDALWLHLAVHEQVEGEWEVLADTMLGVPEGQPATLSVVEGEVDEPSPENSLVFLRATTSRLTPGEMSVH